MFPPGALPISADELQNLPPVAPFGWWIGKCDVAPNAARHTFFVGFAHVLAPNVVVGVASAGATARFPVPAKDTGGLLSANVGEIPDRVILVLASVRGAGVGLPSDDPKGSVLRLVLRWGDAARG